MYAKDYEQGENKTNEGNDMYLLFCIVVRTYGNMQQTNKMVYNGLISFFLILNRNNFFLLNFINIKIFFHVQNVFYFLHTYCTSIFKTFAYRYFFFYIATKKILNISCRSFRKKLVHIVLIFLKIINSSL